MSRALMKRLTCIVSVHPSHTPGLDALLALLYRGENGCSKRDSD